MKKIEAFINESCSLLNEKNEDLKKIKDEIVDALEKIFNGESVTITGRVKSEKSLREKIIRKGYFNKYNNSNEFIEDLSDIIGVRIICLLTKEENKVFQLLKSKCKESEEDEYWNVENNNKLFINLISEQPEKQNNGKDIYRIAAKWKEEDREYNIEIQIKSEINVLWGEIEHKLFYKNYEYLLEQDFYNELMKLIHDNLNSVEKQLELIKKHLEDNTNDEDSLKDYLATILYKKYNNECNKISYGAKLDFRNIYKLAGEFHFTTPGNLLKELQSAINNIKSRPNFDETILSDSLKVMSAGYSQEVKNIAKSIDLVVKQDIFWYVFINIFSILNHNNNNISNYTELLCYISKKIIDKISFMSNNIYEEGEPQESSIMQLVIESWIDYFDKYLKVDILLQRKFNYISQILREFIEMNGNEINNINKENIYLKKYFEIIYRAINDDLTIESINEFLEVYQNSELKFINEKFDDKIKKIIDEELNKNSVEEIGKLILGGMRSE